jgi:hypothetical protein
MKKLTCFVLALFLNLVATHAQITSNKVIGDKNQAYLDSVKNAEYPYLLPIWGKKVTQKGFTLQLPAGLSANYLWQHSDLVIDNLEVGFNNGEMYNLDEIIRFNEATSTSNALNIRPDFWLFPFLNIYGIVARSTTTTAIDAGVWIPNDSTWNEVATFSTEAPFEATTLGFGITPTIGVGGFFMAFDMNFSWSDIPELDKPAFAYVFGPRIGKNFSFNDKMNLAVWAGGFRLAINSGTSGSLAMSDLFDLGEAQAKIDEGYAKVEESQQQVDDWWNSLTPQEQKNPVNVAKYEAANSALATAGNLIAAADAAAENINNSTVQYSLDKRPKDMWNFVIGSQFQLNKHLMLRGEFGFLGTRSQAMAGLQYRFGL